MGKESCSQLLKRETYPGYNMVTVLTVHEVAEQLKTTPQQVRKMIRAGIIPAVKVGREYRVTLDMLQTFLAMSISD